MSESVTTTSTSVTVKHESHGRKRVRHRKKLLYDKILKQMEFYFSDANLTKDRFLGELVKNDPYVPIEVFLKFNKIRAMTQDVIDIAKAMKFSTILELSEDKQRIRRKTAVQPYNADIRTVYVESIPVTANREWLERVFSDYGHVAYISLPTFKNSQKIKGYGFIEFEKPEDAQNCLQAFTEMGCKLPTSMPPEELSSIKTFSIEEPEDTDVKDVKPVIKEEDEPPKKKSKRNKEKRPKNLEFKLGQDSDSEKKDTPTDENKCLTTPTEEGRTIDTESKDDVTSHDESKDDTNTTEKKNRKRKVKSKTKSKNGLSANEAPKGALWGLQILPKSEWKTLRNKYLDLQRKYMRQLKANLHNKANAYLAIPDPATPSMDAESASNPLNTASSKTVPKLEKIPGVFVREILPEPCYDVRLTKRTVRSNIHALHVDAKESQSEIIIRFDSAKAADEYCANSSNKTTILCGAEEEEQWARAEAARAPERPRGRERLRARSLLATAPAPAEPQPTHTHIRFDD